MSFRESELILSIIFAYLRRNGSFQLNRKLSAALKGLSRNVAGLFVFALKARADACDVSEVGTSLKEY